MKHRKLVSYVNIYEDSAIGLFFGKEFNNKGVAKETGSFFGAKGLIKLEQEGNKMTIELIYIYKKKI